MKNEPMPMTNEQKMEICEEEVHKRIGPLIDAMQKCNEEQRTEICRVADAMMTNGEDIVRAIIGYAANVGFNLAAAVAAKDGVTIVRVEK